jgi:signal transduction histidine kinase
VTPSTKHFSIDASVVFQLGENLITDYTQAILELVKNSYDADATFCRVSIDTQINTPFGQGSIVVQDDGTGMDNEAIERGWLTISASPKRKFKAQGRTTKLGRTPLGDKGLGRLGSQRLGTNLEILTSTGSQIQRRVNINWNLFKTAEQLDKVDVDYEEKSSDRQHGTTLTISGLNDIEFWKRSRDEVRNGLSRLISPYEAARDFEIYLKLNGESLELFEVSKKLREAALVSYEIDFAEDVFRIKGRVKLFFLRPEKGKKEKQLFDDLAGRDGGHALFAFLKSQKGEDKFGFKKEQGRWFLSFSTVKSLEDFDKIDTVNGLPASPGPFTGEIDSFSLGTEAGSSQAVFTDLSEYRKMITEFSGIKVYRNGFGIRLARDWLELGEQWTSAPSYYGLKPQNTLGYIAITAKCNPFLVEKTDREGFTENANFLNFREMLRWFVQDVAGGAQEFLRRSWLDFKRAKAREEAQIPETAVPEDLTASVRNTLETAAGLRLSLSRTSLRLSEAATKAESGIGNGVPESAKAATVGSLVEALRAAVAEARALLSTIDDYLRELSEKGTLLDLLNDQIEGLRDQMAQLHEMVALGLTAEALSHEISNIASSLADRTDQTLKYLRSSTGTKDSRLLAFAESVRNAIGSMRREISYLAPSLRYVREKREVIQIYELLSEMYKHRIAHFTSERISVRITGERNFTVRSNRGKLMQIFENLLLNSEYWLKEDLRLHKIPQGIIEIRLQKPYVWLSDNGRGIDPTIEDRIFEPFISAKGRGKGRGLGLFIVQQLLKSENCTIQLLEERNRFDRRVKFELDFRGMLSE